MSVAGVECVESVTFLHSNLHSFVLRFVSHFCPFFLFFFFSFSYLFPSSSLSLPLYFRSPESHSSVTSFFFCLTLLFYCFIRLCIVAHAYTHAHAHLHQEAVMHSYTPIIHTHIHTAFHHHISQLHLSFLFKCLFFTSINSITLFRLLYVFLAVYLSLSLSLSLLLFAVTNLPSSQYFPPSLQQ